MFYWRKWKADTFQTYIDMSFGTGFYNNKKYKHHPYGSTTLFPLATKKQLRSSQQWHNSSAHIPRSLAAGWIIPCFFEGKIPSCLMVAKWKKQHIKQPEWKPKRSDCCSISCGSKCFERCIGDKPASLLFTIKILVWLLYKLAHFSEMLSALTTLAQNGSWEWWKKNTGKPLRQ